jgi:predicted porin
MRKILLATAAGFAALVADGATPARAQSATEVSGQTPQPGLTGYVQGRFRFYSAWIDQDGDESDGNAAATDPAGTELRNFDFQTLGRIWIGADGVAANGLRYGARLEIRVPGSGASSDARGNLFLRRATGYLGTPTLGQLRFGSGQVLAVEMMHLGHYIGKIATGTLDGDVPGFLYTGGGGVAATSFFYSASAGNNFTGIGYYTPQFFGFDAGISYAPNQSSFLGNCGVSAGTAGSMAACDRVDTVAVGNANALQDIIDVMLRYRGTFGPVGVAVSGGLRTANSVGATGAAVSFNNPTVGIIGTELSFGGLSFGGLLYFGDANRGFAALPSAGNNDDIFAWQLGATYTIGAWSFGAAYHQVDSEGSTGNPSDQKDKGFAIGLTYTLAPGLALYLEYDYSEVKESGQDFDLNKVGAQDKFKAQGVLLGVGVQW